MPAVIYYEVTQTRAIKVAANNEVDALAMATAAFASNGQHNIMQFTDDRQARTLGSIEVVDAHITKER